jgi:hypothetical protein
VKEYLIGSGSCGEVFKMEHKPTKMILAVKVFILITSNIVCFDFLDFFLLIRLCLEQHLMKKINELLWI